MPAGSRTPSSRSSTRPTAGEWRRPGRSGGAVGAVVVEIAVDAGIRAFGGAVGARRVALALLSMAVKPDASESAELHEHDAPRPDSSAEGTDAGIDGDLDDDGPDGPAAPPRGH